MFLQSLSNKIKYIGYTQRLSDYEKKRIVVFNKLNFTGFCLAIVRLIYTAVFAPQFYTFWDIGVNLALAFAFVLTAILIHRHLYRVATIASFAMVPALLGISNLVTADSGTEMYLIVFMMLSFFFLHRIKNLTMAFAYCLAIFIVLRYKFQSHTDLLDAQPVIFYYSTLNYIGSFSMIFYTMYLIKFQVWGYEKSIREKTEMLKLSYANIIAKSRRIEEQSVLLQEKNMELTELNNVKIKLFSIISHDLRTSVYAVKNILDALTKGNFSKDEIQSNIQGVTEEVNSCVELMDNLLSWARNQLNENKVILQKLDLGRITEYTYKLYSKKAAEKNIELINNVEPYSCAFADADMMKTVLRNLVGNAVKFTRHGGRIEVITEKTDGHIKLTVNDNGVGISEYALKKIFSNQYYTTLGTGKEMGTGLGLIICRDFVKSNNGDFDVLSKKGEGASFTITLPDYKKNIEFKKVSFSPFFG